MDKSDQQLCSIRIMFPVETDEQAIDYKKKITACVADIPEAAIEFSLRTVPKRTNPNAPRTF